MGIFDKECPQCAASNPISAVRCACGWVFDSNDVDGPQLAPEQIVQEEQLFEEYLAARARQATEVARAAAANAAKEATKGLKSAEAARAKRVADAANTQLAAQRARVAEAQDRASKANEV